MATLASYKRVEGGWYIVQCVVYRVLSDKKNANASSMAFKLKAKRMQWTKFLNNRWGIFSDILLCRNKLRKYWKYFENKAKLFAIKKTIPQSKQDNLLSGKNMREIQPRRHINKVANLQLTLPVSVLRHYKQPENRDRPRQGQQQMGKQTTKLHGPTGA